MGMSFALQWFGNRSLDELYQIKEKEWDKLKPVERLGLENRIKQLENEKNDN